MTPERWSQIKELFYAALDLPPDQRTAFLVRECAGDVSLQAELERLLEAHERPGPFLDDSATVMAPDANEGAPEKPWIGRRVGPYRLIELLGTGGMGEVYKAVRADEQFQQEVAIKLVRGGYDTQQILERFKAERQILATLSHPNIARLLDGGATEDGLPYLVMELIQGERIDAYCQRRRLPVRDRIKLFRDVCTAVSYAHQHLVVHCDLKPGNILVTADGTVKLLDFGVAKLLSQAPRDAHEQRTVTVMRAWTPEFASPEQVRGEGTTTSSDVYSLGVVLYWLLTGRSPYRSGTLPHEIIRDVCDTEPARPSVATQDSGELRGDLDIIAMKALRKEPAAIAFRIGPESSSRATRSRSPPGCCCFCHWSADSQPLYGRRASRAPRRRAPSGISRACANSRTRSCSNCTIRSRRCRARRPRGNCSSGMRCSISTNSRAKRSMTRACTKNSPRHT
jgi:serine/threonine protein kinase